jgi:hypothetical protein
MIARTFEREIERLRAREMPIGATALGGSEAGAVVLITREAENSWSIVLVTPRDPRCLAALGLPAP